MKKRSILIAEDDPDDQLILQEALNDLHFAEPIRWFDNGQQC